MDEYYSLFLISDCITVYSCHNYSIPDVFTYDVFKNISNDMLWLSNYPLLYPNVTQQSKNSIGPLLKLTYQRLINKVNQINNNIMMNNSKNFCLYSGHGEGPMEPLLLAFNYIFDNIPYASLISIELYLVH